MPQFTDNLRSNPNTRRRLDGLLLFNARHHQTSQPQVFAQKTALDLLDHLDQKYAEEGTQNPKIVHELLHNYISFILKTVKGSPDLLQEQKEALFDKLFSNPAVDEFYLPRIATGISIPGIFAAMIWFEVYMQDPDQKSINGVQFTALILYFICTVGLIYMVAWMNKIINSNVSDRVENFELWLQEVTEEIKRLGLTITLDETVIAQQRGIELAAVIDPELMDGEHIVESNQETNKSIEPNEKLIRKIIRFMNRYLVINGGIDSSQVSEFINNPAMRRNLDKIISFVNSQSTVDVTANNNSTLKDAVQMFLNLRDNPNQSQIEKALGEFMQKCTITVRSSTKLMQHEKDMLLDIFTQNPAYKKYTKIACSSVFLAIVAEILSFSMYDKIESGQAKAAWLIMTQLSGLTFIVSALKDGYQATSTSAKDAVNFELWAQEIASAIHAIENPVAATPVASSKNGYRIVPV